MPTPEGRTFVRRSGRSGRTAPGGAGTVAADATILRVEAGRGWAAALPAVPEGYTVTVSVTTASALRGQRPVLEGLGYSVSGICDVGHPATAGPFAHVVVPAALAVEHPDWWRAAAARGDRAYPVAMGPVAMRFRDLIAFHSAHGHGASA